MAFLQFGHSLIFFLQKKISPDTLPIKETNTINSFIKKHCFANTHGSTCKHHLIILAASKRASLNYYIHIHIDSLVEWPLFFSDICFIFY